MLSRRYFFLILLLMASACSTPSPSSTEVDPTQQATGIFPAVSIAWVNDRNLHFRNTDRTETLTNTDDVLSAIVSPSGNQIAFVRENPANGQSLWVINGANSRQLTTEPLQFGQIAWAGENNLYFNTVLAGQDLSPTPQNDLYRIDLTTNETQRLLNANEGGDFSISPDGSSLAISYPGVYGETEGRITLFNPASGEQRNLLTFPAVATGTHQPFYATPQWINASTLMVAIPDADQLYQETDANAPPVALWQLSTDGNAEQIGEVRASLFGLPVWSPDASRIAYLRRDTANTFELLVADATGENPRVVDRGEVGTLAPPTWVDASRFVYVNEVLKLVEDDADPIALNTGALASEPIISGDDALYLTYTGETFTLSVIQLEAQAALFTIIDGLTDVTFDVAP